MTEQLLSQYTRLVDFLGRVLGPDYEIILHEILPEQSRVAAIANGGISGRDVGADHRCGAAYDHTETV